MFDRIIEERVQKMMSDLETQVRTYLQWCKSPAERMLLLEFLQLPGAQPTGFSGEVDPQRMKVFSGGLLDSVQALPITEGKAPEWIPTGLAWLDELTQHRVFYNEKKAECCRVIPKFPVKDDASGEIAYTVDLALFWPRGDGKGHIKIAIECNGNGQDRNSLQRAAKEKHRFLKDKGWIISTWSGSEVSKNPSAILNELRDLALRAQSDLRRDRRTP
jgi:hypothetical protein